MLAANILDAYLRARLVDEGLKKCNVFLKRCNEWAVDGFYGRSELLRLKGELLLAKDYQTHSQEAELLFQSAIRSAHIAGSKTMELRAMLSLAKHWKQSGSTIQKDEVIALIDNLVNSMEWSEISVDTRDAFKVVEEMRAFEVVDTTRRV